MSNVSDYSEWSKAVPTSTKSVGRASFLTIAVFIAAFGYWAAFAPLEGAAVAPGVVAAAGKNQDIQHLEGGIIKDVLVHEGDRVKASQELYHLDQTLPQAQLNRLTQTASSLAARSARLQAERDGKEMVVFPKELTTEPVAPALAEIISEQTSEFETGLKRHKSELSILRQRVDALNESINGLGAQKKAAEDQLDIVAGEIVRKKKLLDKGLTDRSQFTALERNQAELLGQIGSTTASIASARSQIIEAKQQIERSISQRVETASKDLTEARRQAADVDEQAVAAKSVLDRTTVRAPADGIIVRLKINSPGSVVRPGEPLLELLPTSNELIIESKLDPRQVDSIHIGQLARLRFVALNARKTPEVAAEVTFVSPDRLVDEATHQPYYTVRLKIHGALPDTIRQDQIYPGMPVEAYISTGDRTFFEYLVRPIQDSFSRAFREQ